jgi:hypothetical protein
MARQVKDKDAIALLGYHAFADEGGRPNKRLPAACDQNRLNRQWRPSPNLTKSSSKKPRTSNEFLISIGHTVHLLNIKHGMHAVR